MTPIGRRPTARYQGRMTDLSEYRRKGDLSAPFSWTKKIERAQAQAERLHEYVQKIVVKAPPIPPDAREQISGLLRLYGNAPRPAQMRWRLRRYCGDVVEETADEKYLDPGEAFKHSEQCPACGRKPSVIVDAEPIGLAGEG